MAKMKVFEYPLGQLRHVENVSTFIGGKIGIEDGREGVAIMPVAELARLRERVKLAENAALKAELAEAKKNVLNLHSHCTIHGDIGMPTACAFCLTDAARELAEMKASEENALKELDKMTKRGLLKNQVYPYVLRAIKYLRRIGKEAVKEGKDEKDK